MVLHALEETKSVTFIVFSLLLVYIPTSLAAPVEEVSAEHKEYNSNYPLTPPEPTENGIRYRIGLIHDGDLTNKVSNGTWESQLKTGYLEWRPTAGEAGEVVFEWDEGEPVKFTSHFGYEGRGMELSDLIVYDGRLLSFDDKTGLVYELDLETKKAIPWIYLGAGNGISTKGQKSEWATKREGLLYVGSSGNELIKDGVAFNKDMLWVKVITPEGLVTTENWEDRYDALRKQVDILFPAALVHESCVWSDVHKRWFFMPLRKLDGPFDPNTYPHLSTNILLSADENFQDVKNLTVGDVHGDHGFCSFKFIPGTDDNVVVALKSEDQMVDGKPQYSTHIMVFLIDGTVIQDELRISDLKFEGIEFI
ncbi:Soluble calcium-activated nucleotidase 1 [Homalodisca vitripennis]|nr:Soluble calcium-activated nucleotidase 1 [Homalodisca vitripennis]